MPVPGFAGPLLFTTKTARKLLESGGAGGVGITTGRNVSPQPAHSRIGNRTTARSGLRKNLIGTPPVKHEYSQCAQEEFSILKGRELKHHKSRSGRRLLAASLPISYQSEDREDGTRNGAREQFHSPSCV